MIRSDGPGEGALLTEGVDAAVILLKTRSFFCFFFLPMTGAISTGAGKGFVEAEAAASSSAFSFAFWTRVFFCILFVFSLTGAEPIFGGGGELALDSEAEVRDALSDIASLVGVPGPSSLVIDARLGWREVEMLGKKIEVVEDGVTRGVVIASGLAGAAILNVLGLLRGNVGWGTEGFKAGKSAGVTTGLIGGVSEEEDTLVVGFWPTETFKIPGIFFSLNLAPDETELEGPVGIFLVASVGDLTKVAPGVGGSTALPFALLVSSAGKSSDWRFG